MMRTKSIFSLSKIHLKTRKSSCLLVRSSWHSKRRITKMWTKTHPQHCHLWIWEKNQDEIFRRFLVIRWIFVKTRSFVRGGGDGGGGVVANGCTIAKLIAQYKSTFKWIYVTISPIAYLYSLRRTFAIASIEISDSRIFFFKYRIIIIIIKQWTLPYQRMFKIQSQAMALTAYTHIVHIRLKILYIYIYFRMHAVIQCWCTDARTHT